MAEVAIEFPSQPFSHAPPRFRHATFDNYRPRTESQRIAHDAVQEWVRAALRGEGPMLALVGRQGTGKSHLLYAAAGALQVGLDRRPYVRPWYQLGDQLRYGAGTAEAHEVRATLWEMPIVLLDEVRPTSGTNFDDTELAKFACHAYDNQIAVLLTTNWNPLEEVMGGPAASRFAELVIDGPNGRQVRAS